MVSASETPGSKRETRLITYSSGGDSTQIDYILYHKSFSSAVRNVKVIPNEECVKQHYMVVCDFSTHIPRVIKKSSQPCIRTWKMRDPATANQFQSAFKIKTMTTAAAVAAASGADTDTANCVESAWSKLKGPLLDAATELCGPSKNHQWKPEMWWWTEEVDKAISGKRARFKVYSALKKGGMAAEAKEAKLPILITSVWRNIPSDWQSLRQRKRNSPQYPQVVMVSHVLPNRLTAQTRTVYAMMLVSLHSPTKTRWRHGFSTMLGWSILNLSGQATSSLRSLQQLPPPPPPPPPHTHTHTHTHQPPTPSPTPIPHHPRYWKLGELDFELL